MEEFAEILKRLRKEKGLSQEALAEKIHVSRSAIAKYENGLGIPSDEIKVALCEFFQVEKDELFPFEMVENTLVEKNKKIRKQKILLFTCLSLFLFIFASFGIYFVSSLWPPRSGGMSYIYGKEMISAPISNARYFKEGGYSFGYKNAYREGENIILAPEGELWSIDGTPDALMGYYNAEGTKVYAYTNGLDKEELTFMKASKEGNRYCVIGAFSMSHMNFVIYNPTQGYITIQQLEFWC